jgi:hypothetical protein
MRSEPDAGRVSFLGRPLPPAFELRAVSIGPGSARPYDEAEWRDAIVVLEHGEVELEYTSGAHRFAEGSVLWLRGVELRTLRNPGEQTAVLVAVSRRDEHGDEHDGEYDGEREPGAPYRDD